MIIHKDIVVTGRVQGVGFRAGARHQAHKFQLAGWVQNWPDGTVHLAVEGEPERIKTYVAWLKQGPFLARVTEVKVKPGKTADYQGFEIKRSPL